MDKEILQSGNQGKGKDKADNTNYGGGYKKSNWFPVATDCKT